MSYGGDFFFIWGVGVLFYVFKQLHKILDDQDEDGTNPSSCNGEKEGMGIHKTTLSTRTTYM